VKVVGEGEIELQAGIRGQREAGENGGDNACVGGDRQVFELGKMDELRFE